MLSAFIVIGHWSNDRKASALALRHMGRLFNPVSKADTLILNAIFMHLAVNFQKQKEGVTRLIVQLV